MHSKGIERQRGVEFCKGAVRPRAARVKPGEVVQGYGAVGDSNAEQGQSRALDCADSNGEARHSGGVVEHVLATVKCSKATRRRGGETWSCGMAEHGGAKAQRRWAGQCGVCKGTAENNKATVKQIGVCTAKVKRGRSMRNKARAKRGKV